jgi:hypothetical protein
MKKEQEDGEKKNGIKQRESSAIMSEGFSFFSTKTTFSFDPIQPPNNKKAIK